MMCFYLHCQMRITPSRDEDINKSGFRDIKSVIESR